MNHPYTTNFFHRLCQSLCALVLVLIVLSACNKAKDPETSSTATATDAPASSGDAPAVVAITVQPETVPIYGEWVAQTEASQTVNIKARVDGVLQKTSFKEGDYVSKDQVLFQIDTDNYEASLQAAKAELEKAKAQLVQAQQQVQMKEQKATQAKYESAATRAEQDLIRVKALAAQGALSQHDLDVAVDAAKQARAQLESQKAIVSDTDLNKKSSIQTAQATVESAKAAVTQAELNLKYTTIKSPMHGIIGKIQVYPGNLVTKVDNPVLATISAVDPIMVDFNVSESEYLKVAKDYAKTGKTKDAPLELNLADNTVYQYKGKFKLVDRAVDSKTGTIAIEALFPNPQAILRPGEFGRVRTQVDTRKDALLIPDKCIQDLQGSKTVYLVGKDNKVEMKTVTVGPKVKDRVVIESGLSAGDKVITEGLQKVSPGQTVQLSMAKTE